MKKFLRSFMVSDEDLGFKISRNKRNIEQGKKLCLFVIIFEFIFLIIAFNALFVGNFTYFRYYQYMAMYFLMILASVIFYFYLRRLDLSIEEKDYHDKINRSIVCYSFFVVLWGAAITLLDQVIYSNLNAYFANLVVVSTFFYINKKDITIIYFVSVTILYVSLPFVQPSQDILIGHYVNGSVFISFSYIASQTIFNVFHKNYCINKELHNAVEKLEKLVVEDALTGLPNRRGLEEFLNRIENYVTFSNLYVGIIMIDIDFFKFFNDYYGHVEGDRILTKVSKILKASVTSLNDYIVRYGGEEFLYLSVGRTKDEIIQKSLEIRENVESLKIRHSYSEVSEYLTISLGMYYTKIENREHILSAIQQADRALYMAKDNGRNQVYYC